MARSRTPGGVSAREAARRALRRVDTGGAYAALALGGELERARLGAADRRLATEIVYGVLRHQSRIDRALAALAPRGLGRLAPAMRAILRVGAYQILFLDRVPARAAVNDAALAARRIGDARMAGFVNGILRGLARVGEPPLPDPSADPRGHAEITHSLPGWIVSRLEAAVGAGELDAAAAALSAPAPLAVRVNTLASSPGEVAALLAAERARAEIATTPLCAEALLVERFGDPAASESFQRGLWTVQDVGAQLVAHMVCPPPGPRVLDACAGVGGKSTHLAQLTGDTAEILAVDSSQRKLDLLVDATRRLGIRSITTRVADISAGVEGTFDAVLLDAPCTGLGVLRRHPEAKWRVVETAVAEMAGLGARLLDAVAPKVAPGGVLVFSVCTFTAEEGPEQVARFLGRHPEFARARPDGDAGAPPWDRLLCDDDSLRTWPHRHGADAFYAARLRRRA